MFQTMLAAEAYASIVTEPSVKEVLELIRSSNIVIHGIGDALTMARRRNTSSRLVKDSGKQQLAKLSVTTLMNKEMLFIK